MSDMPAPRLLGAQLHLVAVALLASCSTGSAIVTGTARPALDPAAVQVFLEPPSEAYEVVGIVKASGEGMTEQHSTDYALTELKRQAAKIGANGVILMQAGEKSGASYGTFIPNYAGGGVFIGDSDTVQTVAGQAIFLK